MNNFYTKSCFMLKSIILFIFLVTALIFSVQAQTYTTYPIDSEGLTCTVNPNTSMTKLVTLSLKDYGTWNTDPSGVIYSVVNIATFNSDVKSMDIHFNNFQLPTETDVYILNDSMDYTLSALTKDYNNPSMEIQLSGINGNRVTFLCVTKPEKVDSINLNIDKILISCSANRYNKSTAGFNEAGSCTQNINCDYSKDDYKDLMRAVFKFSIKDYSGSGYDCTGTLINQYVSDDNVKQIFLTARHCIYDESMKNKNDFSSVLFSFNYQSPNCDNSGVPLGPDNVPYNTSYIDPGNTDGTRYTFESPVTLLHETSPGIYHGYLGGDMALLQITNPIPPHYNVYYSGWSTFHLPAMSTGYVIGHPGGDIKKFAESHQVINETPFYPCSIVAVLIDAVLSWLTGGTVTTYEQVCTWTDDPYYNVQGYSRGGTQEGSSGSPLFSNDKKIIGVLSGGPWGCTSTGITYDPYGKFQRMWVQSTDVQNALNPEGRIVPIGGIGGRQLCKKNVNLKGVATTARVFPLPNAVPNPWAGYYLKGDLYPANEYQPNNPITINAQNTITVGDPNIPFTELNHADFTFTAGNYIDITPGFTVENGANLNVYIGGCSPTQRLGINETIVENNVTPESKNILNNLNGSKIALYPNPTNSNITVEYTLEENTNVRICIQDIYGETVLNMLNNQQVKGLQKLNLSLDELNSGVYLFNFESGEYKETKRLVVIK